MGQDVNGNAIVATANMLKVITATAKTRPANTTAYAVGDVINESASAGTGWVFSNTVRKIGGSGVVKRVYINDSANVATNLQAELFLFDTVPGVENDNVANTLTDAEMLTLVAVVPVSTARFGDVTSGAGGNALLESADVNIPFRCTGSSTTLFGVLIAKNAYVPVSAEIFTIRLLIKQD